jgi:hypothetical protein
LCEKLSRSKVRRPVRRVDGSYYAYYIQFPAGFTAALETLPGASLGFASS